MGMWWILCHGSATVPTVLKGQLGSELMFSISTRRRFHPPQGQMAKLWQWAEKCSHGWYTAGASNCGDPCLLSLLLCPLPTASAALEPCRLWNVDHLRIQTQLPRLCRCLVYLLGTSRVLINYDLKRFDVPGIKRHKRALTIFRNVNYLMDTIHTKLGLLNIG